MSREQYIRQLKVMLASCQAGKLIVPDQLDPLLGGEDLGAELIGVRKLPLAGTKEDFAPLDEEKVIFVQYSSGSTSEPRGCLLTARAIVHQLERLASALEIDPQKDVGVEWLPLSHDMGLFGCLLLTYWTARPLVLSTPQRFLRNPQTWFSDCARFGATISATPNFGLELATRAASRLDKPTTPLRHLVIGGDQVRVHTLRRACAALGPQRLPWTALRPAYGLAEAVLAVTMTPGGNGPTLLELDADALAAGVAVAPPGDRRSGDRRETLTIVGAGQPLEDVSISTPTSNIVEEIVIQGPTLASGYLGSPELSSDRFTAAGLASRDLGF